MLLLSDGSSCTSVCVSGVTSGVLPTVSFGNISGQGVTINVHIIVPEYVHIASYF